MKQFCLGIMLGSLLTGSLGLAANMYHPNGQPAAPSGSIQQVGYFGSDSSTSTLASCGTRPTVSGSTGA